MAKDHLIGIGGVGMSALAQALIDAGGEVTGADRALGSGASIPALGALARQGVKIFPDDGSGVAPDVGRVVFSSAIEEDNPGLVKARALGIPQVHRAAALAACLEGRRLVAVAGTCGKSTVTAMLAHVLAGAGFDPMAVNGAAVPGWDDGGSRVGSVRRGRGAIAVVEVDESDRSLMSFSPEMAVITNASADHFGLEETDELFNAFARRASGCVIDSRADGEPLNARTEGWSSTFDCAGARWTVPMPGVHNAQNARNAVRAALALGADPTAVRVALGSFPGVERRLQRLGTLSGAAVVDDYAHNTAKLEAMWNTLANAFPRGIAVCWRPHGYGPLRKMKDALAAMFSARLRPQDTLLILPVYDAGGTAERTICSEDLAKDIAGSGAVECVASIEEAKSRLEALAPEKGAIVTCGARDPALPALARRLAGG